MTKRSCCKFKVDRSLGVNLWGRPKSPVNTRPYGPGQHKKTRGKLNDYCLRLRAKQKLKKYYGNIVERQFRRIFKEALKKRGDTAKYLIDFLERRLDTVTYRLKFAPTMFSARQLINHGHILVNGREINIPSYRLNKQDIVEVKLSSKEIPLIIASKESNEREVPCYLKVNHETGEGLLLYEPEIKDVPFPVQMEPNLVIEFYSQR